METESRAARPHKLDGFWYLIRRVPLSYIRFDARKIVRISTGIRIVDDPRAVTASVEVARLDQELQRYWSDLAEGRDPRLVDRARRAAATAGKYGLQYVELSQLERGPIEDLVQRLRVLETLTSAQMAEVAPAVMGEFPAPPPAGSVMVSDLAKVYGQIYAAANARKSPEQLEKWRVPRENGVDLFLKVIKGDKPVASLTSDDATSFLDHWNARVLAGEVEIETANKNIGRIAAMVREVCRFKKLRVQDVFAQTRIKGGTKKSRVAFDAGYVQDVLLADGAMDGLNDEARAIFYVVAETGMRPSEVAGLGSTTIRLHHAIPHVEVRPIGRQLKNSNSERDVPLVGVALEVMKQFPDGFPYYRNRTATLSGTVNKFLRENDYLKVEGQTFYSLRHTFKDRLRDAKVDKEMRDMLMGHATDTEEYGRGFLLDMKREALLPLAFKSPRLAFQATGERGLADHLFVPAQPQPQADKTFRYKPGHARPAGVRQSSTRSQGA